jgi:hypothetical protein
MVIFGIGFNYLSDSKYFYGNISDFVSTVLEISEGVLKSFCRNI